MHLTFDPAKNARNIAERGLSFELVDELDWGTAVVWEDVRFNYGERRLGVLAFLGLRLHAAVVTYRDEAVHVISFRKANKREVQRYGEERRRPGIPSRR
ncbi:BrnT family toxin [Rhodopila sp.]|uniref:BrnT family toxin n=1 Tax=Rhodopila sp. TaxID=2480087 RepID=UPI003D0DCE26